MLYFFYYISNVFEPSKGHAMSGFAVGFAAVWIEENSRRNDLFYTCVIGDANKNVQSNTIITKILRSNPIPTSMKVDG